AADNFLHKWHLVEAERYRVQGQTVSAMDEYDRAITLAAEQDFVQEAAIACERAAQFYLEAGKSVIAKAYLQEAEYYYLQWGAFTKIRDLENTFSDMLRQQGEKNTVLSNSLTSTTETSGELDLVTVMKALQAIAGELVLERLLSTLLKVAIENAGAQAGWLILESNGKLHLEAVRTADSDTVAVVNPISIESSQDVCTAIINYVARTQKELLLTDASHDSRFLNHPYVVQKQPKSILCTPLVNQGKLTGVLYLENNLTTDAFKAERVELLNLLSTQMAIAIENARLLKHQEELNESLQQERRQISRILERITDGFIAVNRQWEIIYVNQQAEQQLGKTSQELIGSSLWDTYPTSVRSTYYRRYHEAIASGRPVLFEEFYPPRKRWFEVSAYPDQEGLSIFARDITERKQMEEKLVHDTLHDALTGLPNRLMLTER
ncbi:MAG TPA: GAF domain-containing protein, partial [Allocoleopsis sp.]